MADSKSKLFGRGTAELAMKVPQRTPKVTSSALRKIGDDDRSSRRRRRMARLDRTWQTRCLDYSEEVGELGALINMQADTVALCNWPIRRWSDDKADWIANDPLLDDDDETDDDYDDRPTDVMRAFVGPQGGIDEQVRRAAYNLFCAGETQLLATAGDDDSLIWEFLSVDELTVDGDGNLMRREAGMGSDAKAVGEDSYTARCWKSSARYSQLADSQVRRVLPVLQEILTLTQVVDAIAKSKIPADILFIPDDLVVMGSTAPADQDADGDGEEPDLVDELFDHVTYPQQDATSAARIMPLVITGKPNEQGKSGIEVIPLSRNMDSIGLQELRQEALGRLADGLDAPREFTTGGKGGANHWTAANLDSEFIVKHIQPIGKLIADFLTIAYLRPMLELFEDMTVEEAALYKVEFNPAPVIARADEAKSARDLADWLSDEAILTANGFAKADMASTETIRQRRLWQLVSERPDIFGKLIVEIEGMEDIDLESLGAPGPTSVTDDLDEVPGAPGAPASPVGGDPDGDIVDATSGTETPDKPTEANNIEMALLVERISTAADGAVRRAMERAGNRVRSSTQGKSELTMLVDRCANKTPREVMALVTPADLRQMSLRPERLIDGAWDELSDRTREWITDFLVLGGMDIPGATERAAVSAFSLTEQLGKLTIDQMFRPLRTHQGLAVDRDLVVGVLADAVA